MLKEMIIGLVVAATAAARADDNVERFTLDNGLRVLIRPMSWTDETAVLVFFNFGDTSDPPGRSGLGHLMEHLYRTAAAGDQPAQTYEELSGKYLGNFGAQTGEDYTVFAAIVPGGMLGDELRDAAARLAGPTIEQSDLDRELPRMTTELGNMYGNNPMLTGRNRARMLARPMADGARRGGVEEQIRAVTLEEARERLRYYKPCNAVLSVAGVVEPGKTRAMIEEVFGALPRGEAMPAGPAAAEWAGGAVETAAILPVGSTGSVVNGYSVPAPGEEGFEAVTVIVSRLQASLADPSAPTRVPPVFHPVLDDPRLMLVSVQAKDDETAEEGAARVDGLVRQACEAEVTAMDRDRVRMALGAFLGLTPLPPEASGNLYGVAFSIGRREQLGFDPAAVAERLDRLTAAELRACYERHLAPERRASVLLKAREAGQ